MPDTSRPVKVIGLVGGIGSGKSEVARALAQEAGAAVIAGDVLAHEGLRQPAIRDQIVQRWGEGILDESGEVDRKKLGRVVFADPTQLQALEGLVHPWIKARIQEQVALARQDGRYSLIVLDAAILLEAGWNEVCDELVCVNVPRHIRLERITDSRGWTEQELEAREKAQLPLAEKARRASHILENSGTLNDLRRQVRALLASWGIPAAAGRQGSSGLGK